LAWGRREEIISDIRQGTALMVLNITARERPHLLSAFLRASAAQPKVILRCLTTRGKNDNEMMMMISAICSVAHQKLLLTCLLPCGKTYQCFLEGGGQMCARTMIFYCRCDQI
jgi:hypothetical protein